LADELIEYLWPGCENLRSAASNLRGRVAELRKILGPSFLLTRRGGYALSAESDCWIDAEEFSHLEELGRRAYRQENYDEAIRRLQEAVALYRGEYLAEDRYEEWALQRRERYRERFVEVLSLLADSLARRGQYARALGYLERAIGEAPLQETLYRQLMVYAFCAGERARALGAYERCRAVLERELGERPSSQTEQLYRQIQSERVAFLERVYPRAAPPSLPGGMRRPPFVGRAREWERLLLALERARAAPFFVMLSGEAGVGKTRLGEEFLRWAHTQGVQTLYGRCYELESPLPWQPWREALRGAQLSRADLLDIPPLWLAELAEVLPELRSLCEFSGMELPGEFRRYRLFEALAAVIGAVAARAPLIVMLDDLQWADSHSLDFLCYLLEKEVGVLLVGAARAEELGGKLDRVCHQAARLGRLEEIPLGRLSEQELQELLTKLADDLEVPRDFGGRLYRESMGNPLLATAVLQALFENGAFAPQGGRWSLREVRVERVPGAEVWLRRRVQRVSAAAQRVFQLLSCAGQLELAVIEAAWEGTSEELLAHLGELISQGLVSERGGRYECAHDKFREVVYEQLEEPRRIWLHRRIAQAIEHVYSDPPAAGLAGQVAQHYERGGQPLRALEWVMRGVEECQRRYQLEEGLQLVEQGMRLLERVVGRLKESERAEKEFSLLVSKLDFQWKSGQIQEAWETVTRLGVLAESLDLSKRVEARQWQAQWLIRAAQYAKALECAQEAYALSPEDSILRAVSLDQIGLIHFCTGDYQAALRYYQEALKIFHGRDPVKEAYVRNSCANALVKLGDLRGALEQYAAALELYREDQQKASGILNNMGAALRYLGEYSRALICLERACSIDRAIGNRLGLGFSLCNLAQVYRLLGAFAQALDLSQQAHQIFISLGDRFGQCIMERWLGSTYRDLAQYEQSAQYLRRALEGARAIGAHAEEGEALVELGATLLNTDHLDEALSCLHQALALSQQHQWVRARVYTVFAEAYLAQKEADKALEAAQRALELIVQGGWKGVPLIRARYLQYRALHALNRPQAPEALRAAQQELLKTADQITDPSLRTSFLDIPLHRQILTELARA
jgi:DNA-binding SARP family transcriptional activator